jgi:hypothetical protein
LLLEDPNLIACIYFLKKKKTRQTLSYSLAEKSEQICSHLMFDKQKVTTSTETLSATTEQTESHQMFAQTA